MCHGVTWLLSETQNSELLHDFTNITFKTGKKNKGRIAA